LLHLDKGIPGVVVGLRPPLVATAGIDDRYVDTQLVDPVTARNDLPDLFDSLRSESVLFEEMAHESDAFDADEELAKTEMSSHPNKDASIACRAPPTGGLGRTRWLSG
jgi:hypothetical protein